MATPKITTASSSTVVPANPYAVASPLTRATTPSRRLPWLFGISLLMSSIALGISGYLTYVAFTSSKVLGCGGGMFDCDHVLHSKWSTLLGLPVAAWASSMYLSVIVALLATTRVAVSNQPSQLRQWTWSIVTAAGVSAGLVALWFTGLQVFVLEHLCPWCLGAHSCGILLCIGTLALAPLTGRSKAMCASLGFTGALGLITIQMLTPEPQSYTIETIPAAAPVEGQKFEEADMFDAPGEGEDLFEAPGAQSSVLTPESRRSLTRVETMAKLLLAPTMLMTSFVGQDQAAAETKPADKPAEAAAPAAPAGRIITLPSANVKLKVEQWPILGLPTADHVIVELFDYTCPHCRKTQAAIKGARESLGEKLAVIVLPVPLDSRCNSEVKVNNAAHAESCEIATTALSLWRADASKFPEFHEWLMTGDYCPNAAATRAKAQTMVPGEKLAAEAKTAEKYIRKHVDIYRLMSAGPVPKLIFENKVMSGEVRQAQPVIDAILKK